MKLLFAWLGVADLRASSSGTSEFSPIASALKALEFDRLILLADHDSKSIEGYVTWLSGLFSGDVDLHQVKLSGPTNHQEIYLSANKVGAAGKGEQHGAQAALMARYSAASGELHS